MVTIINYGSGNINAIANIYERLNLPYRIASQPEEIRGAEKLFLPGVGAFDETMRIIEETGLRKALDHEVLENKVPIIGICVGMQILAKSSEEGSRPGLGYIKGRVRKIDASLLPAKPKLPHLGWNTVRLRKPSPLFEDIDNEIGFYFLHSYYFECERDADILAETDYGKTFASAVHHENVYGMQFHPEKSHHNGVNLLRNFARL